MADGYFRHDAAGDWTTEALLDMALNMLELAREEQEKSRRKDKWLVGNSTMVALRDRVASFGKPLFENAGQF
jgi:hypothetical protein